MKKYNVNIMYHGCISREIEANTEEEALEIARSMDNSLTNDEFVTSAEFMEEDTDVYEA